MKIPTIRQLPSGSYYCQLRIGGQSISITDESEDIVFAKAAALKSGLMKAKKKPEDITLREACTKHIERRRSRLSPTTVQLYESIRDHSFQDIMDFKLQKITKNILDDAVSAECTRKNLKNKTKSLSAKGVKNNFSFIASVLRTFCPDLDIKVSLPEVKQKIPVILPPEKIYAAVKGADIELPCLLAMWLSLSMSEIRGLSKSKSLINGQLVVAETVVDVNNRPHRKEGGKEETRTRAYDIPPYIKALIDKVEGDVIVSMSGKAIYRRFTRILEKNNLPHIPFHRLRHINASVMASLGVPAKEANERGGWKTNYTRERVYTHTFTEQRKVADNRIDNYFENIIADENAYAMQ